MAESIFICRHNKNGIGYCECLGEYCVEGLCTAEELIEYAPVRHGRWVEVVEERKDSHSGHIIKLSHFECSECEQPMNTFSKVDYCPNCGAKMDKEE